MSVSNDFLPSCALQECINLAEISALLNQIKLDKILFLDIETVSDLETFEELSETMQELWANKAAQRYPNEEKTASELYRHAAIYAEFGRIICISCGFFQHKNGERIFKI